MEKSQKIGLISSIVIFGFTLGVIYHYFLGTYLKLNFPYNSFIWFPEIAFSDFTGLLENIRSFAPFQKPLWYMNYFPLAYILIFPFTFIKKKIISYIIFLSLFLCFWVPLNINFFKVKELPFSINFQNIFALTFISYPFLMIIDRGNFDMLLFLLFVSFLYFFNKEKYALSAMIFAIMNAIKPFLAIFIILFLFKKKFKEAFLSLLIFASLVIFGFAILKGNIFHQIAIFLVNFSKTNYSYTIANETLNGMTFSSSLYMPLKLIFCRLPIQLLSTKTLFGIYKIIGFLALCLTIFFTGKEKTLWKQVTLLTLFSLLIPQIVIDYKLIFLFVPLWLFVNAKEKSKFDLFYAIFFGLLLIPKNIIFAYLLKNEISLFSLSIIINPLLITLFMTLIIFEQTKTNKTEPKNEH